MATPKRPAGGTRARSGTAAQGPRPGATGDVRRVLVLDSELESSPGALNVDESVALPWRSDDPEVPMVTGTRSKPRKVRRDGVDEGNVATELLDPFVRAIEILLRGLAQPLGELGNPVTIQFGSTVIQYSSPGWGDDTVSVYRTESVTADRTAALSDSETDAGDASHRAVDRWELGASAAREGDHTLALELFEAEARDAEARQIHQRAAIAYRSASREAGWIGRRDYANKLLRLAGKHYLYVAEEPQTTARGKVQSFVTAAKCFLQAGNLGLAESCIARARSGAQALVELE
jgi:hypothetical protein